MDEIVKLTNYLEFVFLKKIITELRNGSLHVADAKNHAVAFTQIEPFKSIEDAKAKIHNFVSQNPMFVELSNYMDAYHEEQHTEKMIEEMKHHLRNDDVDRALRVATNK